MGYDIIGYTYPMILYPMILYTINQTEPIPKRNIHEKYLKNNPTKFFQSVSSKKKATYYNNTLAVPL